MHDKHARRAANAPGPQSKRRKMVHAHHPTGINGYATGDVEMENMKDLKEALPPKDGKASSSWPLQTATVRKSRDDVPMQDITSHTGSSPPPETVSPPLPPATVRQASVDQDMVDIIPSGGTPSSPLPPLPSDTTTSEEQTTTPEFDSQLYEALYAGKEVQLKDVAYPAEAYERPDLQEQIMAAYLKHTTFTVKVWANFDAAEEKFFDKGQRLQDCGSLRLPADSANMLKSSEVTFHHIRFDIGTAFRTLVKLNLDLQYEDEDGGTPYVAVSGKYKSHGDVRAFRDFIQWAVNSIRETSIQKAMTYQDLNRFAALFKRENDGNAYKQHQWEKPLYGGGEWVGMEEPKDDESDEIRPTARKGTKRGKWVERIAGGGLGG